MNRFRQCIFLAVLGIFLALPARAAPPQTINYQGYLTNPGGAPVNGTMAMTFRFYNAATGGTLLWTDNQPSVTVTNGNFNAMLGSAAPIALPFDVPYWLTVTINTDPEMSPRQPLASSPYSFRAASLDSAATVAGSQLSGAITIATLPAGSLTGTIGAAQIANNAVTQQKLSPISGAAAGRVLGTDGSNLQWQTATAGTVTSVGTGSGLTGGPITGSGTINLATTQLLPATACAANQIAKWNGSAWACAADNSVPVGGGAGQVLAGTGGAAWTDSPSLAGNLTLTTPSTASTGNIMKGGSPFIHNFGQASTFVGVNAGNFTTTGLGFNTGIGRGVLFNITTGTHNTASGLDALSNNTSGGSNTASGSTALYSNEDGRHNTAIGSIALYDNTSGSRNTASGHSALLNNTTGNSNIAIGYYAGQDLTTGDDNIAIGNDGVAGESSTIRIGTDGTHARTFIAGISGVTASGGVAVLVNSSGRLGTTTSSRRFKDDIADMDAASSALMSLRPVTFHYKTDSNPSGRTLQYGLIAEEVAEVYPGLVAHSADGQIETVMYQFLPPMLLNEFQKQQRTVQAQAAKIAELAQMAARMETLERELAGIKSLLAWRQK